MRQISIIYNARGINRVVNDDRAKEHIVLKMLKQAVKWQERRMADGQPTAK